MRRMRRRALEFRTGLLCMVLFACIAPSSIVSAAGEEIAVADALAAEGIAVRNVVLKTAEVTVEYDQPASEVNSVLDVLSNVGTILSTVDSEVPSADVATIVQYFDDGQIMQIAGSPPDGTAFTTGRLSAEEFMSVLRFQALTRGPMMVPGTCEPGKGETCEDYPECGCYPGETCDPTNPQADERGCVSGSAPANAHVVGSQYVCDEGYAWNDDLSDCVPVAECPDSAFFFDGDCHCEPGYEWNAAGTECVPAQQDGGGAGDGGATGPQDDVGSSFMALINALFDWLKSLFA